MMLNRWIEQPQTLPQVTPLWLLPVVGVADIPLALPSVELPQLHAAMVIGLAIGLFFAIPLFTLIFARLLFEPPLQRRSGRRRWCSPRRSRSAFPLTYPRAATSICSRNRCT